MECLIDAKRADVERSFALLAQWLLNGKNYLVTTFETVHLSTQYNFFTG